MSQLGIGEVILANTDTLVKALVSRQLKAFFVNLTVGIRETREPALAEELWVCVGEGGRDVGGKEVHLAPVEGTEGEGAMQKWEIIIK